MDPEVNREKSAGANEVKEIIARYILSELGKRKEITYKDLEEHFGERMGRDILMAIGDLWNKGLIEVYFGKEKLFE